MSPIVEADSTPKTWFTKVDFIHAYLNYESIQAIDPILIYPQVLNYFIKLMTLYILVTITANHIYERVSPWCNLIEQNRLADELVVCNHMPDIFF